MYGLLITFVIIFLKVNILVIKRRNVQVHQVHQAHPLLIIFAHLVHLPHANLVNPNLANQNLVNPKNQVLLNQAQIINVKKEKEKQPTGRKGLSCTVICI